MNRSLFHALSEARGFVLCEGISCDKTEFHVGKAILAHSRISSTYIAYVAYRGTDSTFVGWKEDFNMAFLYPVPSQEEGVTYLNSVAGLISSNLIVGGHTKGGNIAVYSSLRCKPHIRGRITMIYTHDGPGFIPEVLRVKGYWHFQTMIQKTNPIFRDGMLLQHQEPYKVVKSKPIWIMQHDPFTGSRKEDFSMSNGSSSTKYTNEILNAGYCQ